jgi:hypothetical protein
MLYKNQKKQSEVKKNNPETSSTSAMSRCNGWPEVRPSWHLQPATTTTTFAQRSKGCE